MLFNTIKSIHLRKQILNKIKDSICQTAVLMKLMKPTVAIVLSLSLISCDYPFKYAHWLGDYPILYSYILWVSSSHSSLYLTGITRKTACVSLRVGLLQSLAPPTGSAPFTPPWENSPGRRRGSPTFGDTAQYLASL